jgi:hypothetical protein
MKYINFYHRNLIRSFVVIVYIILSISTLAAQWSSNPSSNLIVSQEGNPSNSITVFSNDHYFIPFFKSIDRNYGFYLQVLDFNGIPVFEDDGLLISNHTHKTPSLSDLIVDLDGNPVVAFSDTRNDGYDDITVHKMDLAGNQLWGENGINFFIPGTNDLSPKMVVNSDNSITLCVASFNKINTGAKMQIYIYRISENGTVLWDAKPRIIKDSIYDMIPRGIMNLPGGDVLLAFNMEIFDGPECQIMVKRIDSNGLDVWTKDLLVSNTCLYRPAVDTYAGRDGIFYITWNAHACYPLKSAPYIQGITPDGNILWPTPGVRITEDHIRDQYHAAVQGINLQGDVFVLWYNVSIPSGFPNLYGQLIGQDGELKWGNEGVEIKAKSGYDYFGSIIGDSIIVVYTDPVFNIDMYQAVKVVALNKEGSFYWPHETVLNDLKSTKFINNFTPIVKGQGVVVFSEDDGMLNEPRLVAQNFWIDGTIGPKTSSAELGIIEDKVRVFFQSGDGIIIEGVNKQCDILIYNTLGECLYRERTTNKESQSVIGSSTLWNPGIYFVKILQQGEKPACTKILII